MLRAQSQARMQLRNQRVKSNIKRQLPLKNISEKSGRLLLFNLIFALVFISCAAHDGYASPAYSDSAEVVRVQDGDSIIVKIHGRKEKVRLIGIDAPELKQKPWGSEARRHLKGLITGASIRVETDIVKRDKYGRLLAYIWAAGGRFINLEMIKDGYAVLYTISPNVKYENKLRDAQTEAREKKIGIWSADGLKEAPRKYRKKHPR